MAEGPEPVICGVAVIVGMKSKMAISIIGAFVCKCVNILLSEYLVKFFFLLSATRSSFPEFLSDIIFPHVIVKYVI
ncbi:MAG: hypothetical protein A4E49_01685 [Methanosaeta sp. PtaU1.Bin112]|nr:MAG: hypothetical protein A4E49_01685 [Methanosaeta sp. PtaU1.Bin112]